jgi:hypothetical protein
MPSDEKGRDWKGRFRPGHTGNLRGRPRTPKTVAAAIAGAFSEKVPVTEGGRRRRITKLEAAAKQIANRSASGDPRVAKLGLELAQKAEARDIQVVSGLERLSETDQQIVERLMARMRRIILEEIDGQHRDKPDTE